MNSSPPPYTVSQAPQAPHGSWLHRVRVRASRPISSGSDSDRREQQPVRAFDAGRRGAPWSGPPPGYVRELPAPTTAPPGDTPPLLRALSLGGAATDCRPVLGTGMPLAPSRPHIDPSGAPEDVLPSYSSDQFTFSTAKVLVVASKGTFDPYLTVTDAETGKPLVVPDLRVSTTSAQRRADLFSRSPAQPSAVQYYLRDPSSGEALLTLLGSERDEQSVAVRASGQQIFTLTGHLSHLSLHASSTAAGDDGVAVIQFAPECNLGTLHVERGFRGWSVHPPERRAHAWAYIDKAPASLRRKLRVHVAPDVSTLYMAAIAVSLCSAP